MRYPTPGPHGGAPWRVMIVGVHDGDTVQVWVDRGDEDESLWWVRLKDVHAPELSQNGGTDCRDYVQTWFAAHTDRTDWPFLLETFRTPKSDADVLTLSRHVGIISAADGNVLNVDVEAYARAHGYPGGSGS